MLRPAGEMSGDLPEIDLNCDMGEGMDNDALIIPFVSSVNIACGYHAGDEATMRRTVELALKYKVAIGAHPSYPDREHFGRVDMLGAGLRVEDLPEMITDQLGLLQQICRECGVPLHHVKPHGAMYNRAAADAVVGSIICRAIHGFDPSLLLYGLSGSSMQGEAERCGLRFVREVFADRSYREDGSLTPRSEPGALIDDPAVAARQVLKMIREGRVATAGGNEIPMLAETVCIHGDGSHAADFARMIHEECVRNGISVRAAVTG
jgi:5-oxoprolinase (ATP-hydrolysing) subunit A